MNLPALLLFAPVTSAPAPTEPVLWGNSSNYPIEALKKLEQGTVEFRIEVDANGRPKNCSVMKSSGSPSLDAATCKVAMSIVRPKVVRNEAGEPIAWADDGKVTWVLPTVGPEGYETRLRNGHSFPVAVDKNSYELIRARELSASARLDINEMGKLVGCELVTATGLAKVDGRICKTIRRKGSFRPAMDRQGRPKRMVMTQPVGFLTD